MALGPGAPLAPASRTGSSPTRSSLQGRRSVISSRSRRNRCSTASRSWRSSRDATRSTTPTSSRSSRAIVLSRRSSRPAPSATGLIMATAEIVVAVAIATAAPSVTDATNATVVPERVVRVRVVRVKVVRVRAGLATADAATNRADHISRHRRRSRCVPSPSVCGPARPVATRCWPRSPRNSVQSPSSRCRASRRCGHG